MRLVVVTKKWQQQLEQRTMVFLSPLVVEAACSFPQKTTSLHHHIILLGTDRLGLFCSTIVYYCDDASVEVLFDSKTLCS
mmetsp:Transcript_48364/g.83088  ORF Transcript_48364/g.83088 Transcript_48364/m.83088 type:complete len:80 (+) Transcript_48364:65-304(+)